MKKFNIILILVLCINLINAQNPLGKQWDYRFGGTNQDFFRAFLQTADGGYILGGTSFSGISGDKTQNTWGLGDYWIVKTDSLGSKQWDKNFGGTDDDNFFDLLQTSDGGYILYGSSGSPISGDKTQPNWDTSGTSGDFWIVKIDSLGNKEWDKVYGGTNNDFLFSVQQTFDGGYILGGGSLSGISGDKTQALWGAIGYSDYWIVKIDSLGNKQWDKDFGGIDRDELISLEQTTDGGYILGGSSYSGINGDKTQPNWDNTGSTADYWIVKIDSIGTKQWDKRFGGTKLEVLFSIQQINDKGYIIGGWSYSGISGDKTQPNWDITKNTADFWIVKIDSLGNKQWDKTFGGTDMEYWSKTSMLPDGSYLISGTSSSSISGDKSENNLGGDQIWLVKTDSMGNKQWDKTIFAPDGGEGFGIQSNDGCFVIATKVYGGIGGYKTQPSWGLYDYWIVKFCDTTSTTSVNQIHHSNNSFSIYPNPTSTKLNLSLNQSESIIITNLLGEIILQKTVKGKVELDVSSLSAGIYFVKAGSEVRKFVKE